MTWPAVKYIHPSHLTPKIQLVRLYLYKQPLSVARTRIVINDIVAPSLTERGLLASLGYQKRLFIQTLAHEFRNEIGFCMQLSCVSKYFHGPSQFYS